MDLIVGMSPNLHGRVKIPPNKSHSFRALVLAGLAEGASRIIAPAVSHDWLLGSEALERFGASVEPHADNIWEVNGTGGQLKTPDDVINCGNSGIILRFFTALAACCKGYTVLTGDDSLRHIRPMQSLVDALGQLGAWAVCTKGDGHAPVVVRGRLKGGCAKIDGRDSQPVSALLIASALGDAPTELVVQDAGEKPWVGVTLSWLDRCGAEYSNEDFQRFRIRGRSAWKGFEYTVPSDWSAALVPIVAAVITEDSTIRIEGMDPNDPQGDKAVVEVLRSMGARIEIDGGMITARSSQLTGREIDCNDFIDQLPLLAVVGSWAEGETVLKNAAICRRKECDRITATVQSLKAMGADIEERPDGLVIKKTRLHGAELDSFSDHRMVMALTIAALTALGPSRISNIECVRKTFPKFVERFEGVGADLRKE